MEISKSKIKPVTIDKPVGGLTQLQLLPVKGRNLDRLWNDPVRKHHYLGYRRLLGRRLKYIAFSGNTPIAALSWSAPALKLHVRDRYMGWSDEQRKFRLCQIACNSRFLILPWVRSHNLASRLLSINIGRLRTELKEEFGIELLLLETFVDPRYFTGTCCKGSN